MSQTIDNVTNSNLNLSQLTTNDQALVQAAGGERAFGAELEKDLSAEFKKLGSQLTPDHVAQIEKKVLKEMADKYHVQLSDKDLDPMTKTGFCQECVQKALADAHATVTGSSVSTNAVQAGQMQ